MGLGLMQMFYPVYPIAFLLRLNGPLSSGEWTVPNNLQVNRIYLPTKHHFLVTINTDVNLTGECMAVPTVTAVHQRKQDPAC